jgi:hypothetical protein
MSATRSDEPFQPSLLNCVTDRSQIYLYSNDLAAHGKRQMEKSNISFSKSGMKVQVKNVKGEDIEDKTKR